MEIESWHSSPALRLGCGFTLGGRLTVIAVQQVRRMRGGAQSHLMLGADDNLYVVKFQNNPQHLRVLANELLATRLAEAVGLTVPRCEVIEVSSWLIENTGELDMELGRGRERCRPGLQFGSRFVGGLMPGQVTDYLPEEMLLEGAELKRVRRDPSARQMDGERKRTAGGFLEAEPRAAVCCHLHRPGLLLQCRGVEVRRRAASWHLRPERSLSRGVRMGKL